MTTSRPTRHATGTSVDSTRKGIKFLLHTGAVQPFRVEICFKWETFELVKHGSSNIWSCEKYPPYDQRYCFQYYTNPNDLSISENTQNFKQLPSWPRHVHRDVLLPNVPTAYFLGLLFHLQDMYEDIDDSNFSVRMAEMRHLLYPSGGSKLELQEYLPENEDELKTNVVLSWIISSISVATSPCPLIFLTVLVAYLGYHKLRGGLDIIDVIGNVELRKLLGNLHKAPRSLISDSDVERKLKSLVPKVLKMLGERHWLYVVLYCYPLFDAHHMLDYTSRSHDKPPSSKCISETILPRLQSDSHVRNTRKIIDKIKDFQEKEEKQKGGNSSSKKVSSKDDDNQQKATVSRDKELCKVDPMRTSAAQEKSPSASDKNQAPLNPAVQQLKDDKSQQKDVVSDRKEMPSRDLLQVSSTTLSAQEKSQSVLTRNQATSNYSVQSKVNKNQQEAPAVSGDMEMLAPDSSKADSATKDTSHSSFNRIQTSSEHSEQWTSYRFCVLLEADKVKGLNLYIREDGGRKTHSMVIPMAISHYYVPLTGTSWYRAQAEVKLPPGRKYTYIYAQSIERGYFDFYKPSEIKEPSDRTLERIVNEDVFISETSTPLEKVFIGHVMHEVKRCSSVTKDNLEQLLYDDHAHELHALKCNMLDKKVLKTVQLHITELMDSSHKSDYQVVFLTRLLGNCSLRGMRPALKKVAKNILQAFQTCKGIIHLRLQQAEDKDIASDLLDIVLDSVWALHETWLHLVYYTYPALSAKELCTLYQSWRNDAHGSAVELNSFSQEEVLSDCCKTCVKEEEQILVRFVFKSISSVKVLLRVLKLHGQSSIFQDEHGYKGWVKSALQDQVQSLKRESVEGIHDVWKMVAEMNVQAMALLTRELVIEGLAHSGTWSNDVAKYLFADETFWQTPPDEKLSSSFLSLLQNMLTQSNQQAGIDSFLTVITREWVTRWSRLDDLQKLVEDGFARQLQSREAPAQVINRMYIFLTALYSTRWFEELPLLEKSLDTMSKNFIHEKNQRGKLLEIIFRISKDDHRVCSNKEMELVTKHAVWAIQTRKMTSDNICRLLTPYTLKGQLDVNSKYAADVMSAFMEAVPEHHDDIYNILHDFSFWGLIFQVKGQAAVDLQKQEKYKAVTDLLKSVEHSFLDKSVTVQFIKKLQQQKSLDKLLKLCQISTHHSDEESIICDQSFKDVLTIIKTHKDHLDKFEEFLVFYNRFAMKRCQVDMEAVRQEVQQRRRDAHADSNTSLKSLVAEDYWGLLQPAHEVAQIVANITSSKVFFNICLLVVESECCEVKEKEPLQVLPFAEMLSTKCLPNFRKLCSDIAQGCQIVTAGDIKCVFDGIRDEELAVELDALSWFIEKPIIGQSKEYLKSWVKLDYIRQYAKQLQCLFRTFEVPDQESCILRDVDTLLNLFESSNAGMPLQKVHLAIKRIEDVDQKFTDEDWNTIYELIHSAELIQFLKPIIDDDLRNLTDAVEERSDSFVNESTVSDLIEVQRYMGSFLRVEILDTPEKLIDAIAQSRELGIKKISEKIKTCNDHFHALKNLYNNIAQRGEMTKKIIQGALLSGSYTFVLGEGEEICTVSMHYTRDNDSSAKVEQDDLNDLRSRALLMVNSRMSYRSRSQMEGKEDSRMSNQLQEFIQCVDEVNEIVELCSGLANAGHYNFKCFQESVRDLESLLSLKQHLKTTFDDWMEILRVARSKYHFLNFFHSRQLWMLDEFFRGEVDDNTDIVNLFHYVRSEISVDIQLRQYYEEPEDIGDVQSRIFQTGEALEKIFSDAESSARDIVCLKSLPKATVDNTVQRGSVFVAELDTNSTNSIPVLMTLMKNTTGKYPQANHVLFCHSGTTWEEVYLLLQRCRSAAQMRSDVLYALINVEKLSTEVQFMLVDEVKELQQDDKTFLLAIICCGGCHHHIIDQFSPHFTHQIQGMTANEMSDCLEQGWPDVGVITSEVPGLGKSEYIACKAAEKGKNALLFEVGGPLTKTELVQQLLQKTPSRFQVLHIDVRPTPDPILVDSFIFELLVVGMVVAGTHLCELKNREVFIEIANTQQNHLRDSLTNCSNFRRQHIEWDNYDSFVVSQEINSPVQVVCHYLQAVKDGSLDSKEINFTGPSKENVLTDNQCRQLLKIHFVPTSKMAYTTVNTFLNVLATELKKMSASHFFTTEALCIMLGKGPHCIRTVLFKALDAVAQEFSSRSVESGATQPLTGRDAVHALSELHQSSSVTAEKMVERVKGMVQWADSNHLMVVFNQQDTQTCSTLYRLLSQVPDSVKNLFENQLDKKLPDYQLMPQDALQTVLERICRNTRDEFSSSKLGHLKTMYALTPDNMMKMVLIHMRVKSRVPVVVMGETGCGKTTLITFLARICEVPFYVLNFHAGVSKDVIIEFIAEMRDKANANLNRQIWCFLDEINTCDHLGLLSEIICHQSCLGEQLPHNLVFLAACNPYSMRKGKSTTSGLTDKLVTDEQSKLVYRVHPLPEALMDYVWDYGALSAKDEEAYTQRMVSDVREDLVSLFVDLLIMSQNFIKNNMENKYCVSLRDVNRCKYLANWMTDMLKKKGLAKLDSKHKCICEDANIRAMILALAHCYHSRLTQADDRKKYREQMATIFQNKHHQLAEPHIEEVIREEQLDILNRMELDEGIAKNEALRENVFVVLISILNRIPVFLVGKPGCSKSLSMQLIRSNLRGPDSKDKYFKTLPAVYVVSYQGSESSTSEGIIKVFEKATRYKEHNPDIIPVVLLDEIGLAETSAFNPLKVLHSLLEPSTGDFPDMAVVGISNWALDAAKMNRAVHLSRPEPNEEDLFETAKSIRDESARRRGNVEVDETQRERDLLQLKKLAKAYHDYQSNQTHANFHGLRDYYSLIKSIAMPSSPTAGLSSLESGLRRNFGGIRSDMPSIMNSFMDTMDVVQTPDKRPSALDLIKDNLEDKHARHLMLITSGDSALSIMEKILLDMDKKHLILLGSRFDDDLSEEYNYRILSKIILCMEEGYILVLRDLDSVYSSLYDMLNQNYTFVGKKRHCRVALGAYSNPMCQVHPDFRCIVIIDQQNVDYSDPPLLNRFEKQTLTFMDIVSEEEKTVIDSLVKWVQGISVIEGKQFYPSQAFLGYHNDTLPSLVSNHHKEMENETVDFGAITDTCKSDLMHIASPDAVLRSSKSLLASSAQVEVTNFQETYFKLPLNGGLRHLLQRLLFDGCSASSVSLDEESHMHPCKLIVYTYSSIHVDLGFCLDGLLRVQAAKLSQFKSERQLTAALQRFNESDLQLFILQCKTSLDAQHMLLAKCLIDRSMAEYAEAGSCNGPKHACIVVHVERAQNVEGLTNTFPWQFNFLCGWQQVTLDTLEPPSLQIREVIKMSISEICAKTVDIVSVIKDKLLWCFSCISYDDQSKDVTEVLKLIKRITECPELLKCFSKKILTNIQEDIVPADACVIDERSWQVAVSCEHELLFECASFIFALVEHVKRRISQPLFKIVFFLEENNAWNCFLEHDECRAIWEFMFTNQSVLDIQSPSLPEPKGAESCKIQKMPPQLDFPFFNKLYVEVERHMECLQTEANAKLVAEHSSVESDVIATNVTRILHDRLPEAITYDMSQLVDGEFLSQHLDLYLNDLCNIFSKKYVSQMPQRIRVNITRLLVQHQVLGQGKELSANAELSHWHVALARNSELLAAELQLLHIYQCATGDDPVELLMSLLESYSQDRATSTFGLENMAPKEDEQSVSSEDFCDANDAIPECDQDSEAESFESALESPSVSDGEESVHEENEENSIKYQLVSSVCKMLLPTHDLLKKFHSQEIWVRFVNNILLAAASIEVRPKELHYLHFCKDFVNLLALPSNLSDDFLGNLGELIVGIDDENTLDSESILLFVKETIEFTQHESCKVPERANQHLFLSTYFGRCLEANVETPLLMDICTSLITAEGHLIEGSRLVMWRLIGSEIVDTDQDSVYAEIIHKGVDPDCHSSNLVILDEILKRIPDGLNSHFATLCCDLIEECGFCSLTSLQLMSESCGHVMSTAISASRALRSSTECSLQLVSAVAYLNSLLRVVGEIFIDNGNTGKFPRRESERSLVRHTGSLVEFLDGCERQVSVQRWILRHMSQQLSLFHLRQLVSTLSRSVVFLQTIEWTGLSNSAIGYSPMNYIQKYSEVRDTLASLKVRGNKVGMQAVINKLESSPDYRLALLAVLIDYYYMVMTSKILSDSEKSDAKWIMKQIECTNLQRTAYCGLVRLVSGVSDFTGKLQLSTMSEIHDVQLASVLMHLASVVVSQQSKGQKSSFQKLLCSSVKLKSMFFPAAKKAPEIKPACTRTAICGCGQQFVQSLQHMKHQECPTCGKVMFGQEITDDKKKIPKVQDPVGYIYSPVHEPWSTLAQTGDLSTASQSVIDFMVHGCLYVASQISPTEFKAVSLCSVKVVECRMMELWSTLPLILRASQQDACVLLHCIIREVSSALTSSQYTGASVSERDHQEMQIHMAVEKILQNTTFCKQQFLEESYAISGILAESSSSAESTVPANSIEHHLQELDKTDEHVCKLLPRSSRQKRQASLEDLRACFSNHSSHSLDHFPFLHLVLSQHNALKLVGFLPSLLSWNLLMSSRLSHQRAKRKDVRKPISSLMDAEPNLFESWSAFRDAFINVCDAWTELTGETARPDDITLDSQIMQCLIPQAPEENTLSRMIKTLQGIQNSFLMKALEIAATVDCPAISFLIKDNHLAALTTKPLNQVKKKDVILPQMDQCLCFHDVNTEYGHGTEISYDLNQIEMNVALSTIINKAILTDGSMFQGFVFADDLYHSSTTILDDVASKVKQEALPKDIVNLIIQGDRRRQGTFTNDLLQTVEVLMSLLKRTSGNPEETLEEFIRKWSSIVTIESLDLLGSIKLKHIVALYQQLEVLLSVATVQTLGKEYCVKLPKKSQLELEKCCMDCPTDVVAQFRDILKRFVFRYLRARQDVEPNTEEKLRDILKGMAEYDQVLPLLHRGTQLCHIVSLLEFFNKTIKEKESKTQRGKRKGTKRTALTAGSY